MIEGVSSERIGAWKKMPHCHLLIYGNDDKLYCGYHYEKFRKEANKTLGSRINRDITLDEDFDSALKAKGFVRKCSDKECPFVHHTRIKEQIAGGFHSLSAKVLGKKINMIW